MNVCKKCGKEINVGANFCPSCGQLIVGESAHNLSSSSRLSTWNVVKIYVGSVLLSPFSLYWFFKYFRDSENKRVAYVSLVITVVSFAIGAVVADAYVKALSSYTQDYSF